VVINEALATRLFPHENAVGRRLSFGAVNGETASPLVVGVVRDVRNRSLRAPAEPQVYRFLSQHPVARLLLHVRVARGHDAVARTVAEDVRARLPESPAMHLQPSRALLARGYADTRLAALLSAVFASIALMLAAAGIYGVVSHEEEQRRRDMGIHLALGADARRIRALVIRRCVGRCGLGLMIGFIVFATVQPLLRPWVFGVATFDPVTLGVVAFVVEATAILAATAPAIRAGRIDPMAILRAG
jgi:predicted lysophospholipase L1 biosynthesis ABC-type transport system permease subunit